MERSKAIHYAVLSVGLITVFVAAGGHRGDRPAFRHAEKLKYLSETIEMEFVSTSFSPLADLVAGVSLGPIADALRAESKVIQAYADEDDLELSDALLNWRRDRVVQIAIAQKSYPDKIKNFKGLGDLGDTVLSIRREYVDPQTGLWREKILSRVPQDVRDEVCQLVALPEEPAQPSDPALEILQKLESLKR